MDARPTRTLRTLTGLLLAGYGLLILVGVLPHEALWAGLASLVLGALLLVPGIPSLRLRRGRLVAALGATCVAGVAGFNAATGSGLSWPEWGILLYGALLVAAAPNLERRVGRTEVGTLVGWSFPMLLAPLALFALNGVMSGDAASAATPWVAALVVAPTALALGLFGTDNTVVGDNILVATPRGGLTLDVGLVCAGVYPIILFLGLVAIHAWQHPMARKRLALIVGLGVLGLWLVNVLRLVLLAKVGIRWGPVALQQAHANFGWILFAAFMVVFWWAVLRRFDQTQRAAP